MLFRFEEYEVLDGGITLHFVVPDPGAGRPNDYYVLVTDAELAGASNTAQLRTLVQTKLERKFRAAGGIAARLDPFLGQSLTVA